MKGRFVIDKDVLMKILKAVAILEDIAKIKINQEGWHIRLVNGSRVAMLDLEVNKNQFMEYNIEEEGEIAVDFSGMLKFIRLLNGISTSIVDIYVDDNITLKAGNLKRKFKLLNPEDYLDFPEPQIEYTAVIQVDNLSEIIKSIKAISEISDEVYFELKDGMLIISGNDFDYIDEIIAEITPYNAEGEGKAKYPIDYMITIKQVSAFQSVINGLVKIEFATNKPIKISATDNNGNNIFYMVAPKIEEEIE